MRAVVLAGGWAHPPDDLARSMTTMLGGRGFDVAVVTDPDMAASELRGGCDLLVAGSCWFSMTHERYTSTQRDEFAVVAGADLKASIRALVEAGTPLLAMHTAVLSFDEWPQWSSWLGAEWNWETSFHPPPGPIEVTIDPGAAARLEPSAELHDFVVIDEEYQGLDIGVVDVVARSAMGNPLAWTCGRPVRPSSVGRVAVDLLGHDRRSLDQPGHRLLLHGLLDWLTTPEDR